MIIVTGGTGRLGRAVAERLAELVPAGQLGVSVRDPEKAADLAARGIRVRRGDFDDPEALAVAFEGADQVLIVSGPADPAPHRVAIETAKAAGASRILYTSHQAANLDSLFVATRSHAATEQDLANSGVPFTALRNGFYASTPVYLLRSALETGELIAPEDGPFSWTAHRDLADAAVVALTDPARLDGVTPALTGPDVLDYAEVAALASELTGRKITRVTVPDEEWKQAALGRGMPEFLIDLTLGIFQAARRGEFAVVDPTLPKILGRPATTIREVLAAELAG
ncbi:SDR family oxidoreductase [Kribbella sp. NPDC059898]|uniref:SDR family oxidoreductase n=1 Tax=Kribbella sp. NPDC059898 TaxID=3346995 RepID=UPI003665C084